VRRTHEVMRTFYEKAFNLMSSRLKGPRFFVFCDTEPARSACPKGFATTIIPCSSSEPPWYDMWLMSLCKHNVIANSSYSWWAAWLNPNPGKQVCAPSNFLCFYSRRPSKGIYPSFWTVL
jgi:hypothetical protein